MAVFTQSTQESATTTFPLDLQWPVIMRLHAVGLVDPNFLTYSYFSLLLYLHEVQCVKLSKKAVTHRFKVIFNRPWFSDFDFNRPWSSDFDERISHRSHQYRADHLRPLLYWDACWRQIGNQGFVHPCLPYQELKILQNIFETFPVHYFALTQPFEQTVFILCGSWWNSIEYRSPRKIMNFSNIICNKSLSICIVWRFVEGIIHSVHT